MTYDLTVSRVIRAPRQKVFEAWTSPDLLMQWYGLEDSWTTPSAEVDLHVGGRYRLGLKPPGRAPFYEAGEYREVVDGERLVYTCESDVLPAPTVITVEFREHDEGTEVVVTETGYTDERLRDRHASGWPRFLTRLTTLLSG